jgi:hypothetical protein
MSGLDLLLDGVSYPREHRSSIPDLRLREEPCTPALTHVLDRSSIQRHPQLAGRRTQVGRPWRRSSVPGMVEHELEGRSGAAHSQEGCLPDDQMSHVNPGEMRTRQAVTATCRVEDR